MYAEINDAKSLVSMIDDTGDNINLTSINEASGAKTFNIFSEYSISNALFTGGGVFNSYLISRIQYHTNTEIVIPSNQLINFKESLIFGFLGLLRCLNKNNCFASATGSSKNHSSGDIYLI